MPRHAPRLVLAGGGRRDAQDLRGLRSPDDGFDLIGKHRDLPCESCHVNAIFKGTPKDARPANGVGTENSCDGETSGPHPVVDRCGACHTPSRSRQQ